MHPNPAFRQESDARSVTFARDRGFGVLAVSVPEPEPGAAPLVSHVPFLLNEAATHAELHLVRSNHICRVLPAPAKIVISGPDSYISPDWYGVADQVPTWNYVAVHLTGVLHPLPPDHMRDLLDRQSAEFEERLTPKVPWKSAKMTPGVMDRMMRQILPFELRITEIESTWKLNQNKPDAARLGAAQGVAEEGLGHEVAALAALMRAHPDD